MISGIKVSRSPPTVPLDGRSSNADRESVVLAVSLLDVGSVWAPALVDTRSTSATTDASDIRRPALRLNTADSSSSLISLVPCLLYLLLAGPHPRSLLARGRRSAALPSGPSLGPQALVGPRPVGNLRLVRAVLVSIRHVFDDRVLHLFLQVRTFRAQLGHAIDHIDHQVKT